MRKLSMLVVMIFSVLLISAPSSAHFLSHQEELLKVAHSQGKTIGFPETIQAILLQESLANKHNKDVIVGDKINGFGKRSYGVMQIKLGTARFVIKKFGLAYNFSTDEELLIRLATDEKFNIEIGTLYFKYLYKRYNNWKKAVVAYNRGPGWVDKNLEKVNNFYYLHKIISFIKKDIRPFNSKYNLDSS